MNHVLFNFPNHIMYMILILRLKVKQFVKFGLNSVDKSYLITGTGIISIEYVSQMFNYGSIMPIMTIFFTSVMVRARNRSRQTSSTNVFQMFCFCYDA